MKRIIFISKYNTKHISKQELDTLKEQCSQNNRRLGITGFMICENGVFYQIIEGETNKVDNLFHTICRDTRHFDVTCLHTQESIDKKNRQFSNWLVRDDNDAQIGSLIHTIIRFQQLEKYVPSSLLEHMRNGEQILTKRVETSKQIVMICDAYSYTNISNVLAPEILVDTMLDTFYTIVHNSVVKHGGQVNKMVADSVIIHFSLDNSGADRAIQAAVEILEKIQHMKDLITEEHDPMKLLYTGIGMACGMVLEGTVGCSTRLDYTLFGDTVSRASRLETRTRDCPYFLLFDENVQLELSTDSTYFGKAITMGDMQSQSEERSLKVFSLDDVPSNRRPIDLGRRISTILNTDSFQQSQKSLVRLTICPQRKRVHTSSIISSFDQDIVCASPALALVQQKNEEIEALKKQVMSLRQYIDERDEYQDNNNKKKKSKKRTKSLLKLFSPRVADSTTTHQRKAQEE
jgi:adenylate cyclase